jgi:hypothetical protein
MMEISKLDDYQLIKETVKLTVKGEDELIDHILYTMFSAYTPEPLNLGILAPTSEGKTFPLLRCAELMPFEDLIVLGGATPTAFLYQKGILVNKFNEPIEGKLIELDEIIANASSKIEKAEAELEKKKLLREAKTLIDFTEKILIFLEPPTSELWSRLKVLLSHDTRNVDYLATDRSSKGLMVRRIVLHNWPATIFCSANVEQDKWSIWPEIQSRYVVVSPKTDTSKYKDAIESDWWIGGNPPDTVKQRLSQEQYQAAMKAARRIKERLLGLYSRYTKERHDEPKSLIWIPYHKLVAEKYPAEAGTRMREAKHFRLYVTMSCLINSHKRPYLEYNRVKYPIAILEDLEEAIRLFKPQLGPPPYKLEFYEKYVVPLFKQMNTECVTAKEITNYYNEKTGRGVSSNYVTTVYLEELVRTGYLEREKDPSDSRRYLYYLPKSNKSPKYPQLSIYDFSNPLWLQKAWNELRSNNALDYQLKDYDGTPISIEDLFRKYFLRGGDWKSNELKQSSEPSETPQKNPKTQAWTSWSFLNDSKESSVFSGNVEDLKRVDFSKTDLVGKDLVKSEQLIAIVKSLPQSVDKDTAIYTIWFNLSCSREEAENYLNLLIAAGLLKSEGDTLTKQLG